MARTELPVRQRGESCELPVATSAEWAQDRAGLLRAIADPTRLRMLACLVKASAPVCVCDFTAAFGLSQPTISHHMAKLRAAGLADSHKDGIWTYYRLGEGLSETVCALLAAALAGSPYLEATD